MTTKTKISLILIAITGCLLFSQSVIKSTLHLTSYSKATQSLQNNSKDDNSVPVITNYPGIWIVDF